MAAFLMGSVAVLVLITALFAGLLAGLHEFLPSFDMASARPALNLAILGFCTFAGVMSNSVFERLRSRDRARAVLRQRDVVLAAIVSPIVMFPIYQSLQASQALGIVALTAYQNGFFFKTLFSRLEKSE